MSIKSKILGMFGVSQNVCADKDALPSTHTPEPTRTIRDMIPITQSVIDRWDREWLHYFLTEDPRPFFLSHQALHVIEDLQGRKPIDVYNTRLVSMDGFETWPPLCVWIDGENLIGKHVLEMGCGPGLLGKQMGKVAAAYIGIDYSKLALHIARLTSPQNCLYYHLSDFDRMITHAGTVDTMLGRFFFIHQNYQNLIWILTLASLLLKPGGIISADFYLRNSAVPQGIIHLAHQEPDENYPSCAFEYTVLDIECAARETGLIVKNITDNLDLQRRFTLFTKPSL